MLGAGAGKSLACSVGSNGDGLVGDGLELALEGFLAVELYANLLAGAELFDLFYLSRRCCPFLFSPRRASPRNSTAFFAGVRLYRFENALVLVLVHAVTSVTCSLKPNRKHRSYNGHSAAHHDRDLRTPAQTRTVNFVNVFIAQFGYAPAFLSKIERHIV